MNQPQAPDPYATAAAQTQSNEQTANYQQSLNDVNQITPYGSLTYTQDGTGANGAPQTTANLSLSPELQALVGSNIQNSTTNSALEGQLQGNVGSAISSGTPAAPGLTNLTGLQNLDLSNSALENSINKANEATLDPMWNAQQTQTQQQLYDQGLAPGSEGYTNGMNSFNNARNSAYNSMFVADQGQAAADLGAQNASANSNLTAQNASANTNAQADFGNALTAYNEPLNAFSALQSGSQVSQPGIGQTSTPQTSVAGTNIAGLIEQNYQNQLAQSNATMGGLFGLGGTLGGGLMQGIGNAGGVGAFFSGLSDRRLKRDVSRIGTRLDGIPIYAWRYLWDDALRGGPMAQDVQALYPEAVFEVGGFLAINHARLP